MKRLLVFCLAIWVNKIYSQTDSIPSLLRRMEALELQMAKDTAKDYLFQGTKMPSSPDDSIRKGLHLNGYLDLYYALYSDSTGLAFERFPTISPRNNAFGLNLAQVSGKYDSKRMRGMVTLQAGDVAKSAWSPDFPFLQEANLGIRLLPKFWLDLGYFRTHIGLESIQPRENITSSIALPTYFEPYFLSGVKFTFYPSDKFSIQLNAFNGFNTFTETNRAKDIGVSMVFNPNSRVSLTWNALGGDEAPDTLGYGQLRLYQNFFGTYRGRKLDLGWELNGGWQQHANLIDSTKSAWMYSGILSVRFRATERTGVYARGEFFEDGDEILTGPLENTYHALIGLNAWGLTGGWEYRPLSHAYLRLETRYLHTANGEEIFRWKGAQAQWRWEGMVTTGFWF